MKQQQEQATPGEPRRRQVKQHSAKAKSQAVLALWSGRRSASSLMKELGVAWGVINSWEKRALSGMLTALDPLWQQAPEASVSLPARVEKLMAQTFSPATESAESK